MTAVNRFAQEQREEFERTKKRLDAEQKQEMRRQMDALEAEMSRLCNKWVRQRGHVWPKSKISNIETFDDMNFYFDDFSFRPNAFSNFFLST